MYMRTKSALDLSHFISHRFVFVSQCHTAVAGFFVHNWAQFVWFYSSKTMTSSSALHKNEDSATEEEKASTGGLPQTSRDQPTVQSVHILQSPDPDFDEEWHLASKDSNGLPLKTWTGYLPDKGLQLRINFYITMFQKPCEILKILKNPNT